MKHTIEVVIDRMIAGKTPRARVAEAIEGALKLAERKLVISKAANPDDPDVDEFTTEDQLYSCDYACTHCGISYQQPSPQLFSFNSPQGMCSDCQGLGIR